MLIALDETRPLLIYHGGLEILVLLATFGDLMVKRTAAATFAQLAVSDEYRLAIVAQECVKTLLGLAHVDDDEVRIWAVWTLASLAETGMASNHRHHHLLLMLAVCEQMIIARQWFVPACFRRCMS